MQEQLVAANQAELEKSERIRDLEKEIETLKEQLAASIPKPTEELDKEPPVEPVEAPAEGEPTSPRKRPVKKGALSAKAKARPKPAARGEHY